MKKNELRQDETRLDNNTNDEANNVCQHNAKPLVVSSFSHHFLSEAEDNLVVKVLLVLNNQPFSSIEKVLDHVRIVARKNSNLQIVI